MALLTFASTYCRSREDAMESIRGEISGRRGMRDRDCEKNTKRYSVNKAAKDWGSQQ